MISTNVGLPSRSSRSYGKAVSNRRPREKCPHSPGRLLQGAALRSTKIFLN